MTEGVVCIASPPPSPSAPVASPRPCVVLADCKADCDTEFDTCKSTSGTKCKKKKKCKKNCDAKPNLCPACEDNTIPGFGTSWCKMNVGAAGFCTDGDGKTKCKKTCGLCR